MHRIVLAALLLTACGETATEAPEPDGAATEAPATEPATEPVATEATATAAGGTITKAALDEANALVFPMQPWSAAEKALEDKLGKPTHVEGDNYMWHGKDGETCYALYVQKMGDSVGSAALGTADCPA